MAIDIQKLVQSPPLNQIFGDPNTHAFATANVFFYVNGTTDLKPVFKRTFDGGNPFTPAENPIQLNSTGALPYDIWFYPYEEDTPSEIETYAISVKRVSDNVEIYARADFPFINRASTENSRVTYDNMLPSFDYPITETANTQTNKINKNPYFPFPGWAFYLDFLKSNSFFKVNSNTLAPLKGNPSNLLSLISSPINSDGGLRLFGAVNIGYFKAFSGNMFKIHTAFNNKAISDLHISYVLAVCSPKNSTTQSAFPSEQDIVPFYTSQQVDVGIGIQELDTVLNIDKSYPDVSPNSRVGFFIKFNNISENIDTDITANYLQKIDSETDEIRYRIQNFDTGFAVSLFNTNYNDFTPAINESIKQEITPGALTYSPSGIKNYSLTGLQSNIAITTQVTGRQYPAINFSLSSAAAPSYKRLFLGGEINGVSSNNLLKLLRGVNTAFDILSFSAHIPSETDVVRVIPLGTIGDIDITNWTTNITGLTITKNSEIDTYSLSSTLNSNVVTVRLTGEAYTPFSLVKYWGSFDLGSNNFYPLSPLAGGVNLNGQGFGYNFFDRNPLSGLFPFFTTYSDNPTEAVSAVSVLGSNEIVFTFNSNNPDDYVPTLKSVVPPYPHNAATAYKWANFIAFQNKPAESINLVKPYYIGNADSLAPIFPTLAVFFSNEPNGNLPGGQYLAATEHQSIVPIYGKTTALSIAQAFAACDMFSNASGASIDLTFTALPESNDFITFADKSAVIPQKYVVIFIKDNVTPITPAGTFDHVFYFRLDTTDLLTFNTKLSEFFTYCVCAVPTKAQWDAVANQGLFL